MRYSLIFILFMMLLTGCKGKDLEDRDFVMVLGVKGNSQCKVLADIAMPESNGDSSQIKNYIVEGKGKNISECIEDINSKTSGDIFLGHIQSILVDGIMAEKQIETLVRDNAKIGRDIPVLQCENIDKTMNNDITDVSIYDYINKYFDNYKHRKINIETYINDKDSYKNLPVISIENQKYYIK